MKNKFVPGKDKVLYGGAKLTSTEKKGILDELKRELESGWVGLSKEGKTFEEEMARVGGVKKAVFVNSGTSALDIGFRGLGLPKGSEIIVPACTFPTPIASIINLGLIPVVVDVDKNSYFLSPQSVKKSISKKTKAVLGVYTAGLVGDLDGILDICRKNRLHYIEDNCDGFGGMYKNKMLGSFGIFSAISTHIAHIVTTFEGGVFFTDYIALGELVSSIRDWGRDKVAVSKERFDEGIYGLPEDMRRYIYTQLGVNYKPTELQAFVGRLQLKRLNQFKKERNKNFAILYRILKPLEDKLILPESDPNSSPCYYTFPITLIGFPRRAVLKALDKAGIEWRPVLACNIAKQPAFKKHIVLRTPTPNADRLINDSFWVSIHPNHSDEVMKYVGEVIKKTLG